MPISGQMTVGVTCLALGSVAEQAGDFGLAFDVGDLCEIEIASIRLALPCERVF